MRVCVIGGGNVGTAIAVAASRSAEVVMLTSRPKDWNLQISMFDPIAHNRVEGTLDFVTSDYAEAVAGCDLIFIALPSFLVAKTLKKLCHYLKHPAMVGIIPGTGGAEFAAAELLQGGHTLFGVDRVPYIARITEYGKSVNASPKKAVRLCAIPGEKTESTCALFSQLFDMECFAVKNYLTITLTPSNPILHTARLFSLSHGQTGQTWLNPPLFYGDWDDMASDLLLGCDAELQKICAALPQIPLEVIPLTAHYEANSAQEMTKKLRSLPALKGIVCPMRREGSGYALELTSRYFTEDFPYGLCILRGFASACGLDTPNMDMILRWYEHMTGACYFDGDAFTGKDLCDTGIPQNGGINTIEDIYRFYLETTQ